MSSAPPPRSNPAGPRLDVKAARSAFTFFKVMAFVVGVGLLVLLLEMVLRYGFHNHALDWWPQPHGLIYLVYVAATMNLGLKLRWGMGKIVGVILAGVVPFLSFWVERRISRDVEAQLRHHDGPAPTTDRG